MAFTSNLAAINAANKVLSGLQGGIAPLGKDALKAMRAEFFSIEKIDDHWHARLLKPLPEAAALGHSIKDEREGAFAFPKADHFAQASNAGQAAFANAAAFFASHQQTRPSSEAEQLAAAKAFDEDSYDPDAEAAEAMRQADAQANAQQATSELKNGKIWIHASSCESPVKRVWAIADAMNAQARAEGKPAPSRKEVQDECVRKGVASGTARTQYQAWKKANDNDAANAANAAALSAALNARNKL